MVTEPPRNCFYDSCYFYLFIYLHFWFLLWGGLLWGLFLCATDCCDGLRTFYYNFPILLLWQYLFLGELQLQVLGSSQFLCRYSFDWNHLAVTKNISSIKSMTICTIPVLLVVASVTRSFLFTQPDQSVLPCTMPLSWQYEEIGEGLGSFYSVFLECLAQYLKSFATKAMSNLSAKWFCRILLCVWFDKDAAINCSCWILDQ